ncbi:NADAR family protein [Listeria monocytogenes]
MKVIHFYSENADYGCFSNFSLHPVVIDGVTYSTTEHYFQAQKFIDKKIIKKVINTKKPIDAAKLGRNRDFPLRKGWESMKDEVMLKAIRAKLEQHSENDHYWGDGGDGSGKNRLGKILMKVRDEWNSK